MNRTDRIHFEIEAAIMEVAAKIVGFNLVFDNSFSIYTGEFFDVQWNPGTLYISNDRATKGSILHELGHILTSTPEELASVNYEGGDRKRNDKEILACTLQTYVFWKYGDLFSASYIVEVTDLNHLVDVFTFESEYVYPVLPQIEQLFSHPEMQDLIESLRESKGCARDAINP
jgi:hypothetical protein